MYISLLLLLDLTFKVGRIRLNDKVTLAMATKRTKINRTNKPDFKICGHSVPAGSKFSFDLEVPDLYVYNELSTPIQVVNGKREGPILFVSGSIHGDEIMGSTGAGIATVKIPEGHVGRSPGSQYLWIPEPVQISA